MNGTHTDEPGPTIEAWRREVLEGRFVEGDAPADPRAPVVLAWELGPDRLAAVATREAVEEDGYQVRSGSGGGHRILRGVEPDPRGMHGLGADLDWGYARALFALAPLHDERFSRLDRERPEAWHHAWSHLEQARAAFGSGRAAEALDEVEAGLALAPRAADDGLVWRLHLLAGLLRLGGPGDPTAPVDLSAAEQAFAQAARHGRRDHPDVSAQSLVAAAFSALRQGFARRAVGYLGAAEGLWSAPLGEARFLAARARLAMGDGEAAKQALVEAVTLDRGYVLRVAALPAVDAESLLGFLDDLGAALWEGTRQMAAAALEEAARLQAAGAPDDPAVERLRAFVDEGGDWPVYDELQVTSEREPLLMRLREAAGDVRWATSEEDDALAVEAWEDFTSLEPVREKVVLEPGGLFKRERAEWRLRTREITHQRKVTRRLRRRRLAIRDASGRDLAAFHMVRIPAGGFRMGSPEDEPGRDADEPPHDVRLTRPLWVATTPVHQGLWRALLGEDPPPPADAELPVARVSWLEAVQLCNTLSRLDGRHAVYDVDESGVAWFGPELKGYRLPTEAEWEYLCRAGTTAAFAHGERLSSTEANFARRHGARPTPVGAFAPNPWGIQDAHGNVWEWCWDAYGPYPDEAVTDPVVEGTAGDEARVARGGSWASEAISCRSANRSHHNPWSRHDHVGLRLVLTASPDDEEVR